MRQWYVYLLRCADNTLYTGVTNDLKDRVKAHNEGKGARYTRSRRPVKLLAWERKRTRGSALSREAAVKALPRSEKLLLVRRLRKINRSPGKQ